jgi:hypothetical protein
MQSFDSLIEMAKKDNADYSEFVFCISKDINYTKKKYKGYKVYITELLPINNIMFCPSPFYDNTK